MKSYEGDLVVLNPQEICVAKCESPILARNIDIWNVLRTIRHKLDTIILNETAVEEECMLTGLPSGQTAVYKARIEGEYRVASRLACDLLRLPLSVELAPINSNALN